ncbi:MAG: endonuclease/exonuclease/phosphatase family protein [Actinomycetota bacterium]
MGSSAEPPPVVRFATFNTSLHREHAGQLVAELRAAVDGSVSEQVAAVLAIIAVNDPDVLLINEFDHDDHQAARYFARLAGYEYHFVAPSNTGLPAGVDLHGDGVVGPDDTFGFGAHPGQFGMLVLSRHRIGAEEVRTFQRFRWIDMPDALLPTNPDGSPYYTEEALAVFRLSSKSHWDLPIHTPLGPVHLLASHPTPPAFDGPERRNAARNHDEIRFWVDYVSGPEVAHYIQDDEGQAGGLRPGVPFVVAGDQNADPDDRGSIAGAIDRLLRHPRINTSVTPASAGAVEAAGPERVGRSAHHTADFAHPDLGGPGNLRVDYVLPSHELAIVDAGVFWPPSPDPQSALTGTFPFPASDHRLVWVDVSVDRR